MSYIGRTPTVGNFQICDAISTVNNQAAYTMQVGSVNVLPETANHMIVSLNGVIQAPISSFTVSGSTITFAANLVTGDVINFIQILGDVLDLGVPSDNTVSTAKIVNGAVTSAKLASGVGGVAGITSSANATAMTIDSSEKITLGGATALGHLNLVGLSRPSGNAAYVSQESATNAQSGLNWYQSSSSPYRYFLDIFGTATAESSSNGGSEMRFLTTPVNSATAAERMRIDSSGRLLVGTAAPFSSGNNSSIHINVDGVATAAGAIMSECSGTGTVFHYHLRNGNGGVGGISTNGSATSFVTSSDYRLKENVTDITDATDRLKQLQPKRFNFIADADTTVDGFIAHEVSNIVPEAISGEKDAVDANGNPEYQGIDQSKLVPLLVKTIQELEARITTLENA